MTALISRMAYGRIDRTRLLAAYAIGLGAGVVAAAALLELLGARIPLLS
jgi:hypothetical protein